MLKNIVEKGTPGQRSMAVRTLRTTALLRGQRAGSAEMGVEMHVISGVKSRNVYDAQCGSSLPGVLVRKEGDPPGADAAVNEAYDGAGDTFDLFNDVYGFNSLDGQGMEIDSTVHYQRGYDNAFWNGVQIVYGDGDEDLPVETRLFNRFPSSLDVIGHELAHGVTSFTAKLVYMDQSGALNEHISDVFGSLTRQRKLGQTAAEADWVIGKGLFTSNVNGEGIRSMKAPGSAYDDPLLGKDPQPGHMSGYVNTIEDNGGVHINSGIPNHAFYIIASEIGGFAWEKAGQIWFTALKNRIAPRATFQEAANTLFSLAGELYGVGSLEQQAVKKGWSDVGINVEGSSQGEQTGCLTALLSFFRR
jgi:Zn-dependent metalloprotease